jgi:AraC-like DNA-binding protein
MTITEAVKEGISFIEDNLTNDIGVVDVAGAVAYSQFYFSREFARLTHCTVYDYILRRRVTESYKYLFKSGEKIVDVAYRFGFRSHEVYSRAFRKMFGENPSEAVVYKPLALFEKYDGPYLEFLSRLRTELTAEPGRDFFFEVDTEGEQSGCALMLLGKNNLYDCKSVFHGCLAEGISSSLSFRLQRMLPKLRIWHNEEKLSFRYFFEHSYDVAEMGGNYVLARKNQDCIDFLIPIKQ